MNIATHLSTPRLVPPSVPLKRKVRFSSSVAAVLAVGVAATLTLLPDLPWATSPMASARPLPVQAAPDGPAPISDAVDWSRVELSGNPGPSAIAEYGP